MGIGRNNVSHLEGGAQGSIKSAGVRRMVNDKGGSEADYGLGLEKVRGVVGGDGAAVRVGAERSSIHRGTASVGEKVSVTLMADSEMDLTILLKQRDKEIAGLKADLRATKAQHTADLASTASAANDLVAAVKGTAHDGTSADIVSAATELAVLLAAAADSAADQSAIVGHADATEDHETAADVIKANDYAVNLGATADIDGPHGDVGRGEFRGGDEIGRSEEREVVGKPD